MASEALRNLQPSDYDALDLEDVEEEEDSSNSSLAQENTQLSDRLAQAIRVRRSRRRGVKVPVQNGDVVISEGDFLFQDFRILSLWCCEDSHGLRNGPVGTVHILCKSLEAAESNRTMLSGGFKKDIRRCLPC